MAIRGKWHHPDDPPLGSRQRPRTGETAAAQLARALEPARTVEGGRSEVINLNRIGPKRLQIGIDWGTVTLSVSYRIVTADSMEGVAPIDDLSFGTNYFTTQTVAWDKKGNFYWGSGVEKALRDDHIRKGDRIKLFKLALYNKHEASEAGQKVHEQLKETGHTLEDLISTHFKCITEAVKDKVATAYSFPTKSREVVDGMSVELFVGVPELWDTPAKKTLVDAALATGCYSAELVHESRCATAFYARALTKKNSHQLLHGDVIVVADIGGGTMDITSHEIVSDPSAGAKTSLRQVGVARSVLCGSQLVNQRFISWLKQHPAVGDFKALCVSMQIHHRDFEHEASKHFDVIKHGFTGAPSELRRRYTIPVDGSPTASCPIFIIRPTGDDIAGFFSPVIEEIIECIKLQLTARTTTLILLGGFGQSEYLQTLLQERLGETHPDLKLHDGKAVGIQGSCQPISRGALLRYNTHKLRALPVAEQFGISEIVVWNPKLKEHQDATALRKKPGGKRATVPYRRADRSEISEDDHRDTILYGRWVPFCAHYDPTEPGQVLKYVLWQRRWVSLTQREFDLQLFWTLSSIKKHESMLKSGSNERDGQYRDDIERRGLALPKTLPDLEEHGLVHKTLENGEKVYEIYYRVTLLKNDANIRVSIEIAMPSFYRGAYVDELDCRVEMLDGRQVHEMCNNMFNPIAREEEEEMEEDDG